MVSNQIRATDESVHRFLTQPSVPSRIEQFFFRVSRMWPGPERATSGPRSIRSHPVGPIAAAVSALMIARGAAAIEPSVLFERTTAQVVIVTTYDADQKQTAQANGISVGPLDVVTHCHIVKSARRIDVRHGENKRAVRLRFQDLERNLCQLTLEQPLPGVQPIQEMIPSSQVKAGQTVFAISAPQGQDYTIVRGMLAGLRSKSGETARLLQTDIAITPGGSGSGLFDTEGRLLGLLTSGLVDEQNLNMVLPVEWIQELPRRNLERPAVEAAAEPAAPAAQAAKALPASSVDVLPGARFRYRMSTPHKVLGNVTMEVVSVSGDRIRERVTREGYSNFQHERVTAVATQPDAFQSVIVLPGGYQLPELSPYFRRDVNLRVGQSWRAVSGEYNLLWFGTRRVATDVRVAGKESVLTPAGKFEAWRIETVSNTLDNTGSPFRVKCAYWYPVNGVRTVKMVVEVVSNFAHSSSKEIFELLSYEAGK